MVGYYQTNTSARAPGQRSEGQRASVLHCAGAGGLGRDAPLVSVGDFLKQTTELVHIPFTLSFGSGSCISMSP